MSGLSEVALSQDINRMEIFTYFIYNPIVIRLRDLCSDLINDFIPSN